MDQAILSSAYLGPVGYYSIIANSREVLIEQFDSYHKQTYRNRCRILAANGPLDLIVPVVKESGCKTQMKDVKIDYSTRWQDIHWRSLFSAYNSSPFFEYYSEYFLPYYQKRPIFLLDFNLELMELVSSLIQLPKNYLLTDKYHKEYEMAVDLRDGFLPKKRQKEYKMGDELEPYSQTFADKFGFVPGLSIVDLLFNRGPDSAINLTLKI